MISIFEGQLCKTRPEFQSKQFPFGFQAYFTTCNPKKIHPWDDDDDDDDVFYDSLHGATGDSRVGP